MEQMFPMENLEVFDDGAENIFLRYFHYELQCTVREMEGGIYEKMSTYLGTLARYLPNSKVELRNVLHRSSFFQNGVAHMLSLAEFLQQHQTAGRENHQVRYLLHNCYHWCRSLSTKAIFTIISEIKATNANSTGNTTTGAI